MKNLITILIFIFIACQLCAQSFSGVVSTTDSVGIKLGFGDVKAADEKSDLLGRCKISNDLTFELILDSTGLGNTSLIIGSGNGHIFYYLKGFKPGLDYIFDRPLYFILPEREKGKKGDYVWDKKILNLKDIPKQMKISINGKKYRCKFNSTKYRYEIFMKMKATANKK